MTPPYRVVAWSTGNVGRHAIAGIDARPDLELVGLWVSNPEKVGQRRRRRWPDWVGVSGSPPPTTTTACSPSAPTSSSTRPWPTTG